VMCMSEVIGNVGWPVVLRRVSKRRVSPILTYWIKIN